MPSLADGGLWSVAITVAEPHRWTAAEYADALTAWTRTFVTREA